MYIVFTGPMGEEMGRVSWEGEKLVANTPEMQIMLDQFLENEGDEKEFWAKYTDYQSGYMAADLVND